VNKTNRCTELKFYCYYDSTCFGQPFCPSLGVLSRTSVLVHFMQLWSSRLHKMYQSRCTAKYSWWWTERLPETCRVVIPIKMQFSASVGFFHKESVTIHGHTNKGMYDQTSVLVMLVTVGNSKSISNKSLSFRGIKVLLTSGSRKPRTLSELCQNIEVRIKICDTLITDLPVRFLYCKSCVKN